MSKKKTNLDQAKNKYFMFFLLKSIQDFICISFPLSRSKQSSYLDATINAEWICMFTVLKSGRESEHGLANREGVAEMGFLVTRREEGGGATASRLCSFGPTCSFAFTIAQEYRYHYSLSRQAAGPTPFEDALKEFTYFMKLLFIY